MIARSVRIGMLGLAVLLTVMASSSQATFPPCSCWFCEENPDQGCSSVTPTTAGVWPCDKWLYHSDCDVTCHPGALCQSQAECFGGLCSSWGKCICEE